MSYRRHPGQLEASALVEAASWYLDLHGAEHRPADDAITSRHFTAPAGEMMVAKRLLSEAGKETPDSIDVYESRLAELRDTEDYLVHPEHDAVTVVTSFDGFEIFYEAMHSRELGGYVLRKSVDRFDDGRFADSVEDDLAALNHMADKSGASTNDVLDTLPTYSSWHNLLDNRPSGEEACIIIGLLRTFSSRVQSANP